MRHPLRRNAGWVAAVALVLGASAAACAEEPASREATIAGIRAVLSRQEADWNRGDLASFLDGYWKSPRLVFQSGGTRNEGWDATRERYIKRYRSEGRAMGQVAFSKLEIEPLAPDAAFVRGAWRLTLPDGSQPGGLFTLVFRKLPEGWKIVHDHTSVEDKPTAAN